jgi:hypothetical protein
MVDDGTEMSCRNFHLDLLLETVDPGFGSDGGESTAE